MQTCCILFAIVRLLRIVVLRDCRIHYPHFSLQWLAESSRSFYSWTLHVQSVALCWACMSGYVVLCDFEIKVSWALEYSDGAHVELG